MALQNSSSCSSLSLLTLLAVNTFVLLARCTYYYNKHILTTFTTPFP
uniref:Uncharacterized protein n=1 Tax=Anguilla anguilla TaxID=7936 RepID=A0A0E9VB51_ANGAN